MVPLSRGQPYGDLLITNKYPRVLKRIYIFCLGAKQPWKYIALCITQSMWVCSSVGLATRYGLDGPGDRIPVGSGFSAPVQTGPGANPASRTIGTGSFPEAKGTGRGVDNLEVKERVEI